MYRVHIVKGKIATHKSQCNGLGKVGMGLTAVIMAEASEQWAKILASDRVIRL